MTLSYERAHEVLIYNPETGCFRWKKHFFSSLVGRRAGSINGNGRLLLCVDNRRYEAHRVAWLMTYGEFPDRQIDHINRDPLDNRISNLRTALPHQNTANRTGVRGYTRHGSGKFQAMIKHRGKAFYLGLFDTEKDARQAYMAASKRLHGAYGVAAGMERDE